MNKFGLVLLSLCLVPLSIWAVNIYQDRQIKVLIEAPTYLYTSETDAAYSYGLLNGKQVKPLLALTPQNKLTVTQTTYGKDYWALHVETSEGDSGWVVAGQKGIKIIKP